MHEYEIRVLDLAGKPTLITAEVQLNDQAAIVSARRKASGHPFEVWRDDECIYGRPRPDNADAGISTQP